MFTSFFFQPMAEFQIKSILTEKLRIKFGDTFYFEEAFSKMFDQLFIDIKSYTNNIDEYTYYFSFLYPVYTEKLRNAASDEDRLMLLKKPLSN